MITGMASTWRILHSKSNDTVFQRVRNKGKRSSNYYSLVIANWLWVMKGKFNDTVLVQRLLTIDESYLVVNA